MEADANPLLSPDTIDQISEALFQAFSINGFMTRDALSNYLRKTGGPSLSYEDYLTLCQRLGCNQDEGINKQRFKNLVYSLPMDQVYMDSLYVFPERGIEDKLWILFHHFCRNMRMKRNELNEYFRVSESSVRKEAVYISAKDYDSLCTAVGVSMQEGLDAKAFIELQVNRNPAEIHEIFWRVCRTSYGEQKYNGGNLPPPAPQYAPPVAAVENQTASGATSSSASSWQKSEDNEDYKEHLTLSEEVLRRLERIFWHFSKGKKMGFQQLRTYQKAIGMTPISHEDYLWLCEHTRNKPDSGIGFDTFLQISGAEQFNQGYFDFESPCTSIPSQDVLKDQNFADENRFVGTVTTPKSTFPKSTSMPIPQREYVSQQEYISKMAERKSGRNVLLKARPPGSRDQKMSVDRRQSKLDTYEISSLSGQESSLCTYDILLWLYNRFREEKHFTWRSMCALQDAAGYWKALSMKQYETLCQSLSCYPMTGLSFYAFLQAVSGTPASRIRKSFERVRKYDAGLVKGSISKEWASLGAYIFKEHANAGGLKIPIPRRDLTPGILFYDASALKNKENTEKMPSEDRKQELRKSDMKKEKTLTSHVGKKRERTADTLHEDSLMSLPKEEFQIQMKKFRQSYLCDNIERKVSRNAGRKFHISTALGKTIMKMYCGNLVNERSPLHPMSKHADLPEDEVCLHDIPINSQEFRWCEDALRPSKRWQPERRYKLERAAFAFSRQRAYRIFNSQGVIFFHPAPSEELTKIAVKGFVCEDLSNSNMCLSQLLAGSDYICMNSIQNIPKKVRVKWRSVIAFASISYSKEVKCINSWKVKAKSEQCIPCFIIEYSFWVE